jgi:hypothetical protein
MVGVLTKVVIRLFGGSLPSAGPLAFVQRKARHDWRTSLPYSVRLRETSR